MPYAKIEPSGCGEFHGNTQVRYSFFLKPSDAGYWHTFGQVPIIPPEGYLGEVDEQRIPVDQADYDAWRESLPKKWQLVPFHNHFVYFDPDVTDVEMEASAAFHLPNFYRAWCEGLPLLDAGMRKPGWMRRGWDVKTRIRPLRYEEVDEPDIFALRKAQCLERAESLKSLSIVVSSLGEGETFPATEIDIGADATNRNSRFETAGITWLAVANPANDTGTIDTIDIWADTELANTKAGTFYSSSSPDYTPRDFETIGTVTVPSNQTPQSFTGLDCDVTTSDYIGIYYTSGKIEAITSGGSGIWYYGGDGFGGEQTYTSAAGYDMSLYGSGETPTDHQLVTPTTLALSDAQYVPIIKWGIIVPVLALSDTEYAPSIIMGEILTPTTLALTLTEYIPVLHLKIIPPLLALSDTEYAPVIKLKVIPPLLALTTTIYTPVYGGGVVPITLTLSDTEFAPTVLTPRLCIPTTLVHSITEYAPVFGLGYVPTTLALTDTEYIPVIKWGIIIPVLALSDTEFAPIIKHQINIPLLALVLTEYAPDTILGVIISGALGYTIEVRDGAGNLLAIFENAFGVSLVEQLNRPPMLDFGLPADDSKLTHLAPGNEIWLRDYQTGVLVNKFLVGRRGDRRE